MNGVYILPHRLGICLWVNLIDLGYFNFGDPLIKFKYGRVFPSKTLRNVPTFAQASGKRPDKRVG